MANRSFLPPLGNYEENVVFIWGSFVVGASGAVGTVKGGGITSVVKESTAGQYTVTLTDRFPRLLSARAGAFGSAILSVLPNAQVLADPATLQANFKANGTLVFQFTDETLTAANPDEGSVVTMLIAVRNSSVGIYD